MRALLATPDISDGAADDNDLGSNTLDKNLDTNTIFLRKRMLGLIHPRAVSTNAHRGLLVA